MAGTSEPVRALAHVLSTATDDGVAARLVVGVLQAVDAPTLKPVCPGSRGHEPALTAAAFLDASALSAGLAWSARTALTLYDAHESWSGGVDELEEEQGRDLVVRVAALAAVAASLHPDAERGLARLLDSPAGRSLLYVLGSVELLLSRGTAFEPVEPGVMSELMDTFGEAIDETFDAVKAAGGHVDGARGLIHPVAAAIEDAAEAVGDRIEDIAEAVRAVLPQLDGAREAWAAEARQQRVYGLLVGRVLAEHDGVSKPSSAAKAPAPAPAAKAAPPHPTADLAPLRADHARMVAKRGAVAGKLDAARTRRQQLAAPKQRSRPQAGRPAETVAVPHTTVDAVRQAAEELRGARHHLRAAQAARGELRKPDPVHQTQHPGVQRAANAVQQGEAAVGAVQTRRDALLQRQAAEKVQEARQRAETAATNARRQAAEERRKAAAQAADAQRRAVEQKRRRQLEARRSRAQAAHVAVAAQLQSRHARRTQILEMRDASEANPDAAPSEPASTPSREDFRIRAILRGEVLRARAQVVTARADASRRMQAVRALRAPPAPARPTVLDVPTAKQAIVKAQRALTESQDRLQSAQQARRSRTEQLRALLVRTKARHAQTAPSQKSAAERKRRLSTQRYANHRSLERSAARPDPVPREVQDTLTPERREQLEDVIFDANQALHRARWALSRARSAQADGAPAPPEAPDHRHIHRILLGARAQVASAERTVTGVRDRFKAAADARQAALIDVKGRRNQLLRALGSAQRRRDSLRTDRKTVRPRQRALTRRLEKHAKAPPPTLDRTPLDDATSQLRITSSATAAAQETLAAIAARGGSLPPLPEPRASRPKINLRALARVVRKAEKTVRHLEGRRSNALAKLAALRAPLQTERTRLVDHRAEASATLEISRQLKSAALSRATEVRTRLAEVRAALAAPVPSTADPVRGPRQALAKAQESLDASQVALAAALHAHEKLGAAPQAGDRLVIAEATRHACAGCRAKADAANAAVVAVQDRQNRHGTLTTRRSAVRTLRAQAQTRRSEQASQREAIEASHAEAALHTTALRERIAAPSVSLPEDPELTVIRELAAASSVALTAARAHLASQPKPHAPPPRPTALDTRARSRRLTRARKSYAKFERQARTVETQRDAAYVALRREHHAALSGARPTRRLVALRRRKSALVRALGARRDRIAALHPTPASVPAVGPELQSAVETAHAQLSSAREVLGQRVSAVAEVRSQMGRAKTRRGDIDDRIDEIDARLARWTRRQRRAQRAIDRLQAQKTQAQKTQAQKTSAQEPAPPPPVTPLDPPPPPAPGVPVLGTMPSPAPGVVAPPPPPAVISPMVEIASDPSSFEPQSAPPPMVPTPSTSSDEGPGRSSVKSLLARIAARRQARKGSPPPRRKPDGGSAPPPLVPGLRTATAQIYPDPPSIEPAPSETSAPPAFVAPPSEGPPASSQLAPAATADQAELASGPADSLAPAPPLLVGPPPTPDAPAVVGPPPPPAVIGPPPSRMSDAPVVGVPVVSSPSTASMPPVVGPPPAPTLDAPPPAPSLPSAPPIFNVDTERLPKPTFEDSIAAPPPAPNLSAMPPPPPLDLPGSPPAVFLPPPIEDLRAPDELGPPPPDDVSETGSNQDVLNAKTVILSLEDLRKNALDDDDDDDDDWPGGDGAATVLLSREDQLKRREALLSEAGQGPKRRREAWKPPGRGKTK